MKTKERLILFIEHLNLNAKTFEESCGISNGYVNNIRESIGSKILEKISNKYANLNTIWLLHGEGKMLKNKDLDSNVAETAGTYLVERRNKKNESKEFRVPLVTVKARAGYVTSYDNTDVINSLEKYAVPPGVTYTGAIWRYFEVDGDSMEPVLVTGDYVLCSQVPQDDWENIRNFYVHVLVTETEILIKRIFVKETGQWVLISDNETHKQKFFDVPTLKELWVFRRLIKKTISAKKVFKITI